MKEPVLDNSGLRNSWQMPDKEWLENQYWTLDKPAGQIADAIGADISTVGKWLYRLDIQPRTKEQRYVLMSERALDKRANWEVTCANPGAQKRQCLEAGRPYICSWCGKIGNEELAGSLQIHHKDHHPENGLPENLVFLCPKCHKLETALWHIRKSKKAKVTVANKIITIDFNI